MKRDKGGESEDIHDRRLKPMQGENQLHHQQKQKCPRCESLNIKFCYYNDNSLSQPRYFCKSCRRYWTQGRALRNVPAGVDHQKGNRAAAIPSSSSSENSRSQSLNQMVEDGKDEEGANEDSNDEEVDKTSLPLVDIKLLMERVGVTRSKAVKALKAADGDLVSAIMELIRPDKPRVDDEDDEEGSDGDNEDDMDREVDEGTDVWGNANGDKFYKSEGNGKFLSGEGGGGSSGSGSNAQGEREDGEEDFGLITMYDEVIKEAEVRGAHLPSDMVDASKSVGIREMVEDDKDEEDTNEDSDDKEVDETSLPHLDIKLVMEEVGVSRSKAVKALKAADGDIVSAIFNLLPEPDEHRVDDEDDEEWSDEDNEDGVDREAAEDEFPGFGFFRQVDKKPSNINKYNLWDTTSVKAGEMHGMVNLKGQGKKVRRAGSRRTCAKLAMRKQREAVQPTRLLAGLKDHPSMYIRLGQQLPERHCASQNTWTKAFEVFSTATVEYKKLLHEAGFGDFVRIQPFKIRSGGYTSTLVERYFSETHTLHLGTFEIGPTPLAWTMITGIRFGGDPLNPPDITPQKCAKLLGLRGMEEDFFVKGKLNLNALCPSGLDFSKNPTDSDREWMFRRLIVYLVGSCFFCDTDLMVPIRLVSAMSDIRKINQYDWGAATFSAFLRGMRQKTSKCCGTFSGFYPFLLLWAYEHIPYMRPLTKSGTDTFPLACRWDFTQMDVPIPNDFIWHRLELEYIEDEVNFDPYKELWEKKNFSHERALSQNRVVLLGLESWELYMGERNLRQFGGRIQIPYSPPAKRFCERSENFTIDQKLLLGENAWGLLEDEGFDYVEWFRTNSLGRIVALDQFQGRRILGGRSLELWLLVHRDGHKVISPQDLRTLQDGPKKWEAEYQKAKAKLKDTITENKTLRKDVNHWKQIAMLLTAERDLWQSQASDAQTRLMTSVLPYPTQASLFYPEEMVPFPQGYMNPYYGNTPFL